MDIITINSHNSTNSLQMRKIELPSVTDNLSKNITSKNMY